MNELSYTADARWSSIGGHLSSDPRNRRSAGFQPFPDLRCASMILHASKYIMRPLHGTAGLGVDISSS